jgi:hypothetical protein
MLELYTLKHDTNLINRYQRGESRGTTRTVDHVPDAAMIQNLNFYSSLLCRGGSWLSLNDVSLGECTNKVGSVEGNKSLLSSYAFVLAVLFFCAKAVCAFSCALRNIGAFSHGLDLCTISFRLNVVSLAANGCVRGMPYFTRYDRPSNPCSFRCLTESCLKLALHSRHITICLVMLFRQLTGFNGVSGVTTATLP